MSWRENRDNAFRAGVATGFVLLGASIVLGMQMTGLARLLLAVLAPLLAVLVGVYTYRSATGRGAR